MFAAITAAEHLGDAGEVTVYEATAHPLAKVLVSGGGRCNVTHACFEPRELVTRYPRGGRELLGAFHRWQPKDTVEWFASRGVALKTEADGRMFPTTDRSATIAECLLGAAENAGVHLVLRQGVKSAHGTEGRFTLELASGAGVPVDRLLIATGGNRSSAGFAIASGFGHTVTPLVPSLFTFSVDDPRLRDLAGLSVAEAEVWVEGTKLRERGPLLITHAGLSGPAVIKLSAWGARAFAERDYTFTVSVNFWGRGGVDAAAAVLGSFRAANPRKHVASINPFEIPQRLWERLVQAAGLSAGAPWTGVANASIASLAAQVCAAPFNVTGKSAFKEEFVTCGGVALGEVDFKTLQSRKRSGLFFAGEVLDIDGVTGGFNFQSAWTTGWLSGVAMAS